MSAGAGIPESPLRIGVVCFSTFGGSGVVATEAAIRLAARGHELHLFSDERPARLPLSDRPSGRGAVTFHQVAAPSYPQLRYPAHGMALTSKIVDVCRRSRLDVVHAHYALPHTLSAYLAREVLRMDGDPAPAIVTTLHGTDITLVGSDPTFLPLTRFTIAASDAVTTPSRWLAEATRLKLAIPARVAIDVVPNFVDVDRFTPAPPGPGAGGDPPVIVHVSNFRPLKRVADVIAVFARLRAARPLRLRLVGDGPERARIEADVAARGLGADVDFVGERVDLPEVLRGGALFLLPSETESFGLAALEAMACGVPVVASAVGGLPEVIPDGEAGFLRPVGDVAALADAAGSLLADEPLRHAMGAAARRHAETHYRIDPAIDRYVAIYRRVVTGPLSGDLG
jgi:N-acetyl-alpha-D-glucosaminyl L-malate synthase BshA